MLLESGADYGFTTTRSRIGYEDQIGQYLFLCGGRSAWHPRCETVVANILRIGERFGGVASR